MPVTYTKEQKDEAKKDATKLVTIAAGGLTFQEAVSEAEEEEVIQFLLAMRKKARERACVKLESLVS